MARRKVVRRSYVSPAWGRASAEVVQRLDDDDLLHHLTAAVRTLVAFESAIWFINRRNLPPLHIYDTIKSAQDKKGITNYIRSTYLLNPFYNAFLRGIRGGVYRIATVAPDAYFKRAHFRHLKFQVNELEEIGYLTQDWPPGRAEIIVAMEFPHGEMGELSMLQPVNKGGFAEADLRALESIQPFLAAAYARYWRRVRPKFVDPSAPERPSEPAEKALTPREREIAYLILHGHSTPSISLHLRISETTVKTHRKNLYAKLGIASQYELFTMFMKSIRNPDGTPLRLPFDARASSSFGRMALPGRAD